MHWTDHKSPAKHSIPHEQFWNWSDPDNPTLPSNSKPPSNPPSNPPTSEGEEPWYQEDQKSPSDEDKNDNSNNFSSKNYKAKGITILLTSGAAIIWLAFNDVFGVGIADNAALIPAVNAFLHGLKLVAT